MSDNELMAQTLLQQQHARPVSGSDLEVLGKRASALYFKGEQDTLSGAVVEVVKQAQLSPEQVKRVIEFANQAAYLEEFKKEGAHRIVNFPGGPANPSTVLKDLNDGGGGTVFDRGTFDYAMAPKTAARLQSGTERMHSRGMLAILQGLPEKIYSPEVLDDEDSTKTASTEEPEFNPLEDALWAQFGTGDGKIAYAEPMKELEQCFYKLSGASQQLQADIDTLEVDYGAASKALYSEVKQASLSGISLGDALQAWSDVAPSPEHVKAAFQILAPRLQRDGVFQTLADIDISMHKVGSTQRTTNKEHPLVTSFETYCEVLSKLAGIRQLKNEIDAGVTETLELMKEGGVFGKKETGGLLGKSWRRLGELGDTIGSPVGQVAHTLTGVDPKKAQNAVRKGVQYGAAGTALLGANAAQQEITDRPGFQTATRGVKAIVPGTDEYNMRRYRIMSGGY